MSKEDDYDWWRGGDCPLESWSHHWGVIDEYQRQLASALLAMMGEPLFAGQQFNNGDVHSIGFKEGHQVSASILDSAVVKVRDALTALGIEVPSELKQVGEPILSIEALRDPTIESTSERPRILPLRLPVEEEDEGEHAVAEKAAKCHTITFRSA